jgi:hypothetical protein
MKAEDFVRLEFGHEYNPMNGTLACNLYIKYPNGVVLVISPTGEVNIKYKEPEE